MSGGGGHIQDMINRVRQNRAQRAQRSAFKDNRRENFSPDSDRSSEPLIFKTVSTKELKEIKKQMRQELKANRIKERNLYAIFLLAALVVLIYFLI